MNVIKEHLKPIAQRLLQARLDGGLKQTADFLVIIHQNQPKEGLTRDDITDIGQFMNEIIPCNIIPNAKVVAAKHDLTLSL